MMITFRYSVLERNLYFVRGNTSKYKSLKEELLSNAIYPMDIRIFHSQLSKAYLYATSNRGKKLKAKYIGGNNDNYETPVGCSISVAHILCLIVYTNLTKLQYEFKKMGTRKHKKNQTLKELMKLNTEINRWYSLLFEAITFYGSETKSSDIFYTGLNIQLLFDSFTPKFNAPFSTTVDLQIANQFCSDNGLILKMQGGTGIPAEYFDVEWLSNFPNECERLFFWVRTLRIVDIHSFHQGNRYYNKTQIKALRLWSELFSGLI